MSYAPCYLIGLDFGQAQDVTALAVVERTFPEELHGERAYAVRELKRFPLGTAYPEIISVAQDLGKKLSKNQPAVLVADQTGVGRPVVDMLRRQSRVNAVTITAGSGEAYDDPNDTWRVAKVHLAGLLQILLQTRRLKVAKDLPEADVLVNELLNFKVKIVPTLNHDFESWREREHDDLVLAVGIACWAGERYRQEPLNQKPMVTSIRV